MFPNSYLIRNVLSAFIVLAISLLSGALNWINQFIIVSIVFFVSALLYNKKFKISRFVYSLFFLVPFLATYTTLAVLEKHVHVYPIAFSPLFSFTSGLLINYYHIKNGNQATTVFYSSLFLISFLVIGFIGIPNWLEYSFMKNNEIGISPPDLYLTQSNQSRYYLNESKEKIIILDFWTTSCGICIKKFPELQEVMNYYDSSQLEVAAVHLFSRNDHLDSIQSFTSKLPYKFNFYYTDMTTADSLKSYFSIYTVPTIVVLNKNNKVIYNGNLNTNNRVLVNNIYDIINKELKNN